MNNSKGQLLQCTLYNALHFVQTQNVQTHYILFRLKHYFYIHYINQFVLKTIVLPEEQTFVLAYFLFLTVYCFPSFQEKKFKQKLRYFTK